jgi:aerobic-type carbon monoxide dehydrogenase small subunit (CoxS/CutS family)
MVQRVTLNVNGKIHEIEIDDPDMPLLYALRDDLGLNNPRFGCGLAQCGACTVLVDGATTRSCVMPVSSVEGREITTLAGLGSPEVPHPLQSAWIEEQVNQCGYCINGWIMEGAALLARNPKPSEKDVRDAFSTLICRCGTHNAALRAVLRASAQA